MLYVYLFNSLVLSVHWDKIDARVTESCVAVPDMRSSETLLLYFARVLNSSLVVTKGLLCRRGGVGVVVAAAAGRGEG